MRQEEGRKKAVNGWGVEGDWCTGMLQYTSDPATERISFEGDHFILEQDSCTALRLQVSHREMTDSQISSYSLEKKKLFKIKAGAKLALLWKVRTGSQAYANFILQLNFQIKMGRNKNKKNTGSRQRSGFSRLIMTEQLLCRNLNRYLGVKCVLIITEICISPY